MWWLYVAAGVGVAAVLALAIGARRRGRGSTAAAAPRRERPAPNPDESGFHGWNEEFSFDPEVKRAEAARASRTAEFYSHLAEEQQARAEELIEESEQAAERTGLEDVRARHPELEGEQPSPD